MSTRLAEMGEVADAVESPLMSPVLDLSRIAMQGCGEVSPLAEDVDSGAWQWNRRLEAVIGNGRGGSIAARS